jgi:hypothetical protein
VRAASSRTLDSFVVFARRVRDDAGPGYVRQLRILTGRLFNREILPLDFALCVTRLFHSHQHLLPALFQLLSHPSTAAERAASKFKRVITRFSTLPVPWEEVSRPNALAPTSAGIKAASSPLAHHPCPPASASSSNDFQILATTRSSLPFAARAIVAGNLHALGCPWGSMLPLLPTEAKDLATRSLSQFVVALNDS